MSDMAYTKLATANIQDQKNLVISACSKGGYTLAQQINVTDGDGKKINVYLKGAVHVNDADGLRSIRDALNIALDKIEKS